MEQSQKQMIADLFLNEIEPQLHQAKNLLELEETAQELFKEFYQLVMNRHLNADGITDERKKKQSGRSGQNLL
jgi:hypothetical protein